MSTGKRPLVEILDTQKQADTAVKEKLNFHQNLIYAILVVTAVGFVAVVIAVFDIFIQYRRFEAEKYNEYVKMLQIQNDLVTSNQNKNLQLQLDQIKTEIDSLWENKYPIKR